MYKKPLVSMLSAWEYFWVVEITVNVGSGVDMSLNLVKIIWLFTGISSCELHSTVLSLARGRHSPRQDTDSTTVVLAHVLTYRVGLASWGHLEAPYL